MVPPTQPLLPEQLRLLLLHLCMESARAAELMGIFMPTGRLLLQAPYAKAGFRGRTGRETAQSPPLRT